MRLAIIELKLQINLSGLDVYSVRGGYVSWRCARAVKHHKKAVS